MERVIPAERINQIEERVNKAWRGPWKAGLDKAAFGDPAILTEIKAELKQELDGDRYGPYLPWTVEAMYAFSSSYGEYMDRETAQFIAHARADIPWLIRELRKRM